MAGSQTGRNPDKDFSHIINEETNQINDGITHLSNRIKPKRKRARRKSKAAVSVLTEQNLETDCSQGSALYLNTIIDVSADLAANVNIEKLRDNTEKFLKMDNSKISEDTSNKSDKIAQRKERKQAKLAAKMKSKNKSDDPPKSNDTSLQVSEQEKPKTVNQLLKLQDISKSNKEESSEGNTINTSRTGEIVLKIQVESSETKVVPIDKAMVANKGKNKTTDIAKQTEKNREEIKAEREARKKAKLDAKLKGKANKEVSRCECEPSDKSLHSITTKESNNISQEVVLEKNESGDATGKTKAELRAERRAKQEAQRAAKEAEKRIKLLAENKLDSSPNVKKSEISLENKSNKGKIINITPKVGHHRVKLFSHLKFEQKSCDTNLMNSIHPQVVQLAVKYSSRIIMGSNARCIALLKVLKEVIMDYVIPSEKEFSRALESHLSTVMGYLNMFRPSSVSMTNAVRHIKSHLTQLPNDITDVEARRKLCDVIDIYIREQIDVAGEAICNTVQNKIANGDNILIYACSSLLYRILVESHKSGKQFTVVVVDSGPWFEGREMLRRLVDHGIKCSYVLVSALTFIMRGVSKVLLGAHALLANGSVMSRTGSALVALVANSYNVPVLVCCETYKFCERVQMDAFVYNELGNDEDMEYSRSKEFKENESASLSVLYDITPADLVTAVVTELAILPCTSVPVILRIKPSDVVT